MPEALCGFYTLYKEISCSDSNSHALGRHISLKICQKLKDVCCTAGSEKFERFEECITGEIRELPDYERDNDGDVKLDFHFGRMDTLPYWYDDIARPPLLQFVWEKGAKL